MKIKELKKHLRRYEKLKHKNLASCSSFITDDLELDRFICNHRGVDFFELADLIEEIKKRPNEEKLLFGYKDAQGSRKVYKVGSTSFTYNVVFFFEDLGSYKDKSELENLTLERLEHCLLMFFDKGGIETMIALLMMAKDFSLHSWEMCFKKYAIRIPRKNQAEKI